MADPLARAEIAVIGGSGFYRFLDGATEIAVDTPYGAPSGPIVVGTAGDRRVAFLPRHGAGHQFAPHQVNARANLWALRQLGVHRVIGPCACGSLRPELGPGDLVVLDQLMDRTWGRADTYLDGSTVEHVGFADPYCPELRSAVLGAARATWPREKVNTHGTVVVVQGPRFSTRAESRWYSEAGVDVINMTQYPEAYLARELGICYAGVALVTDRDVGIADDPGAAAVTMEAAMAVLADNVERVKGLLLSTISLVPDERGCGCAAGGAPSLRTS